MVNKALYNYIHKKCDEMNVMVTVIGNKITLFNPKPRHSIKMEDILVTAGYEYTLHRFMDNGSLIYQYTL